MYCNYCILLFHYDCSAHSLRPKRLRENSLQANDAGIKWLFGPVELLRRNMDRRRTFAAIFTHTYLFRMPYQSLNWFQLWQGAYQKQKTKPKSIVECRRYYMIFVARRRPFPKSCRRCAPKMANLDDENRPNLVWCRWQPKIIRKICMR